MLTQSFVITTRESTAGTKYTVRRTRENRDDRWARTAARANAAGFWMKMVTTMRMRAFMRARQKTGSAVRISL